MSEARLKLTNGQNMMAASPPPNTRGSGTRFQREFENCEPLKSLSFLRANFCDLGSASCSQKF